MKMKAVYFLSILLLMGSSVIYSEDTKWHYFDIDNKPLPQYEFIYGKLKDYFKDSVPQKIVVKYITGNGSRFDPINEVVLISEYHVKNDPFGVIAHESCHLCLENYTKKASIKEEFRFFDEGFADIFQSIITQKVDDYKNQSLTIAAIQNNKNNVNFEKVQKWSEYFGDPQSKTNYYAYQVGSSFDFFVADIWGIDRLFAFFKDIGETGDLEKSFENVFKNDKQAVESAWLQYLKKVNVSNVEPHIIKLFPADLTADVSIKISEIYVEFDVPMARNIILISNCNSDVCYKEAYWKTDKILAVKVTLSPNYQYQVYLGDSSYGRFMSQAGVELPVSSWSFKTGFK